MNDQELMLLVALFMKIDKYLSDNFLINLNIKMFKRIFGLSICPCFLDLGIRKDEIGYVFAVLFLRLYFFTHSE